MSKSLTFPISLGLIGEADFTGQKEVWVTLKDYDGNKIRIGLSNLKTLVSFVGGMRTFQNKVFPRQMETINDTT